MKLSIPLTSLRNIGNSTTGICARLRDYLFANLDEASFNEIMQQAEYSLEEYKYGSDRIPFRVITYPVVSTLVQMCCKIQGLDYIRDEDSLWNRYPSLLKSLKDSYVDLSGMRPACTEAEGMDAELSFDRNALLDYLMANNFETLELSL